MTRSESLNELHTQFDLAANAFCDATGGLYCEIGSSYKGEENPDDLQYRSARIYYHMFVVQFQYMAHGLMSVVNSILDCSIFLDKSDLAYGIPLPMLLDYCNVDTAVPLCIPAISGVSAMQQAFDCISCVLRDFLPRIGQICSDPCRKRAVEDAFQKEVRYVFDIKEEAESAEFAYYSAAQFFTQRFCDDAFIAYIKGNCDQAVKKLSKQKRPTGYEKRMLRILQFRNIEELPKLTEIRSGLEVYTEKGSPKNDKREFITLLISWLLLMPIPSALYLGIFFLLTHLEGASSVYLMGPIYNFPHCIMCGFITAIAISYFTRFRFYKWLFRSDYESYCQRNYIQDGAVADRFMKGFLIVLISVGIVLCVLFAKWNLNFLPKGFYDNTKFLSLKGEYHDYKEIDYVYYKPNRVNDFGDTLDYPSYVLVMTDGKEIDLYEFDEVEQYEEILLNHLRAQGVKIVN